MTNETQLLETYTMVYERHSATTNEVADAIFLGDQNAALETLTELFGKPQLFDDLETGYVSRNQDGSHPRRLNGEYLPAVWQCYLSCDYGTLEESLADAGWSGLGNLNEAGR